ncbi:MAG TPA: ComEC/Rec2 family competence protein [Acidobacteriaceae bacterium]|nr:ComEC/Rec2 family competence protein [Acidobacteriaceae bacterium]
MATIVARPQAQSQRPVQDHASKNLLAKPHLGAIEHDPVRFTRAPLLFAALAFAAGILITSRYWFTPAWLGIATLLEGLLAAAAARWKPRVALWPLAATWLLLGGFAAEMQPRPAPQTELRHLAQNEPVTLTGTIERASPIRRIVSFRPFSDQQITEQMQSVDLRVRFAGEPGDPLPPIAGGLRLSLYAPTDATMTSLGCGDLVTVTATIKPPERYRDPGVWDSPAWMLSQGIGIIGSAKAEKLHIHGRNDQRSFACLQHALQTAVSDRLMQFADIPLPHPLPAFLTLSRDDAAMLSAMVTGDRSYLGSALRTPFERTGSFHLLVVSGLHLGIFAAFVFALGRQLRIGRLPLTAITLALSFAYALLTGFGQPVQRAFAMVALYLIGRLLYRDRSRLNSLGFAALCLLALDPHALFDAGLEMTLLTVVAVAGIAIPIMERTTAPFLAASRFISVIGMDTAFEPRLAQFRVTLRLLGEHLEPLLRGRPRRTRRAQTALALIIRWTLLLFDLCLVSATIELVMALPMAAYFHRVTSSGVLVNVLIVPALTLLLPAALITTLALLAAPHIAWLPAAATAGLLHAVLAIVRAASAWRLSEWRLPGPNITATFTCLALLAVAVWLVRTRSRFAIPIGAAALIAAAVCALMPHNISRRADALEISAIDVGQGDAIFVVSPDGRTMLVDAGGPTGGVTHQGNGGAVGNFDIGEDVVSPYLWSRHVRRLDIVALTHAHSDHMGGMPAVLRNFRPRELWVGHNPPIPAYQQLLREAASLGIKVRSFSAGDTMPFGIADVHVLAPAPGYQPRDSATNDDSLVLHLSYAGHSALLEGDAEAPSEAAMLSLPASDLSSDLLKVGHHGSKTSTIPPFLARVAPHLAAISVGPYNSYHHPRWETLEKLQDEGAHTWRTDLLGVSTFYIDGTGAYPASLP